jgi:hypothetical protein
MDRVLQRIERWRTTRRKLSPMPAELWAAAVSLAREHGVSMTSKMLGLSYQSLKDRMAESAPSAGRRGKASFGFVELNADSLLSNATPSAAVVEISDSDGARLVIRLRDCSGLDPAGLAEAFWRRRS